MDLFNEVRHQVDRTWCEVDSLFLPRLQCKTFAVAEVRVRMQAMEIGSEMRWDANMECKSFANAAQIYGPRVLSQMMPQTSEEQNCEKTLAKRTKKLNASIVADHASGCNHLCRDGSNHKLAFLASFLSFPHCRCPRRSVNRCCCSRCSVGAKLRERHLLVACTGEEVRELMAVRRKPTEVDALSLHHHPLLWRSDCLSIGETRVCVSDLCPEPLFNAISDSYQP